MSQRPVADERVEAPSPTRLRRTVIAGGVGSVIEYYDFSVYAFLATTMAVVFFPAQSATAGLLSTLLIFGVAFVFRPIGGIVIGHITDRYGRKTGLSTAVIGMAVATGGIGLIPGYAAIGIAAPILLAVLRAVQGLAAGGELGGASAYVAEAAPDARRGFYASSTQVGVMAGTALGSLTVTVLRIVLTQEQMVAWGWRLPFLFSVVLTVAATLYRRRMEESEDFERLRERRAVTRMPFLEVFRGNARNIVAVAMINLISFAAYYLVFTFMATYFSIQGTLNPQQTGWAIIAALVLCAAATPLWGMISDRVGRKPVIIGMCAAHIVLAVPLFMLMSVSATAAVVSLLILGQIHAACLGILASTSAEMFPAGVRSSGFNAGFNIASIVGGCSPYIVTWLMDTTGDLVSPAYFLIAVAALSLIFTLTIKETAGKPLPLD